MKKMHIKYLLTVTLTMAFCLTSVSAQLDLPQGSQMAKVSQTVGITDIIITYSRPRVNEREIWGKLVPYGMNDLGFGTAKESPWRAGANENTTIKFETDVKIEGKDLAAGKYGLHMVVHENDRATIIFSKNYDAWGSYFYDPAADALKVDVSTKEVAHTELLTFDFNEVDANSATASLRWGEKQIPFKIAVDVTKVVLADIRKKLENSPGFNRQTWEQAANYSLNNDGDLNEALGWIDAAIAGQFFSQRNYNNLSIKSRILSKQGKTDEAYKIMDEALKMASVLEIHTYGRQLIGQGQKDKALEVFKMNAKKNKGQWPVDFGLARGYSANGNYKRALKHLKIAATKAPDKLNKDAITGYLEDLKKGKDIN
jgi:tetratricopeptide (TPR) repeat protein